MKRNPTPLRLAGPFLLAVLAAGCAGGGEELPPGLAQMADEPAGAAVLEAIAAHGGWSAWTAKETVEYEFSWTVMTPDGAPGMSTTERHRFHLSGRTRGRVDRIEEDLVLGYNGHVGWAARDGGQRLDQASMGMALPYIRRLHWMFRVPFNLVEVNSKLVDEGSEGNSRVVKILYPVGMGVVEHEWSRIWIDKKTGLVLRLYLNAERGGNWMEFSDHREVDGLQVPHRRRIYQVTPDGERGALTHEMELRNIRFNVPIEDPVYDPPAPLAPPGSDLIPPVPSAQGG